MHLLHKKRIGAFNSKRRGFALLEAIVYVTLLSVIAAATAGSLIYINRLFRTFSITREMHDSASVVMERLIREVDSADSIDLTNSVFSVSPGRLVLNGTDTLDTPYVIDFYVDSEILKIKRDGVIIGPITTEDVRVTELMFDRIVTTYSEAVKISFVLKAKRELLSIDEKTFNTTVIVKGSY